MSTECSAEWCCAAKVPDPHLNAGWFNCWYLPMSHLPPRRNRHECYLMGAGTSAPLHPPRFQWINKDQLVSPNTAQTPLGRKRKGELGAAAPNATPVSIELLRSDANRGSNWQRLVLRWSRLPMTGRPSPPPLMLHLLQMHGGVSCKL